ncbi:hypothetical protein DDB_G0293282 [Dictyostelium discoideum AX4]|uniref:EGF-like domain-containing protein n=1 Tax=Dictyostelium discoideum TaxID=44689 RepID=Q54C09_DICDI|nr:hypothetical protein DDB_G0293282 [Dictyostelium discoideum AX4]EAL60840.1 hypothetical protein DDB_G0293282 [Dictyostelium discoideum AX4]|eukprot:XP_629257.1 hypothetical protein DDB_G0293282 [Dictyostelium discoideum AX4]
MECSLQNQIKASDFVNNFFKLYFDEVFILIFSKCSMEPGFLGQSYSCPVIQGDSTFTTISCNISNFLKLKDESNIKNQCSQNSYCLTNNASCICNYGFTGLPDCTTIHYDCINDCSISIGGGTCDYLTGICSCNQYRGKDCSEIQCQKTCFNGGVCDMTKGECKCIGNYFGDDCLSIYCKCKCIGNYFGDDCLSINCTNNCQNGGNCDTTLGECKYIGIYFGNDCLSINCPKSCMSGGSCDHTTGECNCLNQYQGEDCSSNKCILTSCLNGGTCDLSTYQCQCINGYQGDDCSLPFIECENIYQDNGYCNNQTGNCNFICPTQCFNQGKCDAEIGVCGEVTLFGWFGGIHFDLTVTIGQLNCKDPKAIDNKTIKCELPQGQSGIQNVNVTQNQIIWMGKDLFIYLDNEDPNIKNNCLKNCNSKGVCLSSVDSKDTNGKTTIDDSYNNYEIFIDKLIELNFNGKQVKIYDINQKWEKVKNDTTNIDKSVQLFNQKLDDNQVELIYKVEIIDQTKDYTFSDLNYRLEKDSIKISIFIYNYTYSSTLNTLQLQIVTKTEEKEIKKDKCNNKETEIETTSNQLLNFITIKKDNKVLYGRFINKVISDGRPIHLKTSIISSDKSKSTITMGMDLPHCKNCLIDPDFSLLLTTNFKDLCGDNDNRKSYIIPVAVVTSFVGVAAIGASGFLVYRKKKVEVSQLKLRKLAKNQ